MTIYSISTYEEKEVNGQSISTIRDLEEVKSSNVSYYVVDSDEIKKMFHKAKYRPEFVVWKGDRLGIAKLSNGDESIIRISDYGKFFSIEGIEGFYEFNDE
ncbi:hypothetical protein SDC9_195888 [bioreactor metagenome]|uniref:Uncharacterized protein n=1 Tax=bioreactor metagenome TaxID=1076179 RepID=A0A645IBS0_9ZZZZ